MARETRRHQDLDLAIPLTHVTAAVEVLGAGTQAIRRRAAYALELRSDDDRRIDLHPLSFDAEGNGFQRLQDGSCGRYDAAGLSGRGTIGGREVRCLSAEFQMRFHDGYEPGDADHHDVRLLVEQFGLRAPSQYG